MQTALQLRRLIFGVTEAVQLNCTVALPCVVLICLTYCSFRPLGGGPFVPATSTRPCHSKHEEIQQLAHSEHRGSQQEPQEPAHLQQRDCELATKCWSQERWILSIRATADTRVRAPNGKLAARSESSILT